MLNRRELLIGSIVTTLVALSKARVPTASEIEYAATISQLEKDGFVFFGCNEPLPPDVRRALRWGRAGVTSAFSPDGARVVTGGGDKIAYIWDARTGELLNVLSGHEDTVFSAAFSPDGRRVVTASNDRTARIWDVVTGAELMVLRGQYAVYSAAFSPNGEQIITASYDAAARIWDVATGTELMILVGHDWYVHSATFSPDGRRVVTASCDMTARILDLPPI